MHVPVLSLGRLCVVCVEGYVRQSGDVGSFCVRCDEQMRAVIGAALVAAAVTAGVLLALALLVGLAARRYILKLAASEQASQTLAAVMSAKGVAQNSAATKVVILLVSSLRLDVIMA